MLTRKKRDSVTDQTAGDVTVQVLSEELTETFEADSVGAGWRQACSLIASEGVPGHAYTVRTTQAHGRVSMDELTPEQAAEHLPEKQKPAAVSAVGYNRQGVELARAAGTSKEDAWHKLDQAFNADKIARKQWSSTKYETAR